MIPLEMIASLSASNITMLLSKDEFSQIGAEHPPARDFGRAGGPHGPGPVPPHQAPRAAGL